MKKPSASVPATRDELLPSGMDYETDFAEWLQTERGYDKVKLRKRELPKSSVWNYEVDVVATRNDPRSERLWRVGLVVYILVCATYFLGIAEFEQMLEQAVTFFVPSLGGYALLVVGLVGFVIAMYGKKRLATRAYIECKDWKRKVGRPEIDKIIGRMHTIGDAEQREAGREKWMIVSRSGFSQPALEAAKDRLECYVGENGHFEPAVA